MQSRLGLQQTPKGPARVRTAPKALPKRDGPLWNSVQVTTEDATMPGLKCLNCGATFCGGATRIREHITGLGSITACTCETNAFLDFKQKMLEALTDKQETKKQKFAEAEVDSASDAAPDVKERERRTGGARAAGARAVALTYLFCERRSARSLLYTNTVYIEL